MIELRTLGTVQLDAPARPEARGIAAQPKRLALLIYLALAKPSGPKRRDTLLALFWPETDQERGRQVLRQTVYLLRQSLGADAIQSRGDEDLQLDSKVMTCDATRFEDAVAAGRLAEALDLYHGDFLPGFHVPGIAPEFEEWLEEERRRLRAMASTAAWTLAAEDERASNSSGALYWARRATQLDRDNEVGVRDLMALHGRLGDRVGALRVYEEHAGRIERDLGAKPGAELTRLAAQLRAALEPPGAGPVPPAVSGGTNAPQVAVATVRRSPFGWLAVALTIVAVGAVALLVMRRAPGGSAPPLLAVGPIVDVFSKDSSAESPVASDLLATSLARLNGLQVIPEVRLYDVQAQLKAAGAPAATLFDAARQAGAVQMLRGTIHRDGGRLAFEGQVLAMSSGTVVRTVRVDGKDVFDLVDRATEALAQSLGVASPAVPIADVTTKSLVAYRLYQEGLRAYYAWDGPAAQGLFRAAEAEDSSFAMAVFFDGIVATISSQPGATAILDRAARLAERAPDRERLLIRYRVAATHQSPAAVPLAETLSVRYPNDLDAVTAVAALRQRSANWSAAAALFREVIRRDSLSLKLPTARCLACDAYVDLWWTYIYADSMAAAEAAMREWESRQGPRAPIEDLRSIALERQGRFAEAMVLWRNAPEPTASFRRALIAIREGAYAAARDTLNRLRASSASLHSEVDWWIAVVLRNQGRPQEALALGTVEAAMRATLLFESGRYREAAAISDAAARDVRAGDPLGWPRRLPWQLVHLVTALAAAGDTNRLSAIADSAQRIGAGSFFGRDPLLHHHVRGLLWLARGDTVRAAESFRAAIWSWTDGYTRSNYELAKALLALGRAREAIYPLQAALRGDLQSSNLYMSRTELHALLARAFAAAGNPDSAARHRRQAEDAWAHAEADLPARRAIEAVRIPAPSR